jgi:hypothetical protein
VFLFQEDQAEHHVLVLGRVHVAAHLVRRCPQLRLESERRAGVFFVVALLGISPPPVLSLLYDQFRLPDFTMN